MKKTLANIALTAIALASLVQTTLANGAIWFVGGFTLVCSVLALVKLNTDYFEQAGRVLPDEDDE